MEEKIEKAYIDCIIALRNLTPNEALEILTNLRTSLINTQTFNVPINKDKNV